MLIHIYKTETDENPIIYENAVDIIMDDKNVNDIKINVILENNKIVTYKFSEILHFIQSAK
jgi:hypothetical protein